jgi:enamine deaminase RidA (YjgF/YER057c/UK114 family)
MKNNFEEYYEEALYLEEIYAALDENKIYYAYGQSFKGNEFLEALKADETAKELFKCNYDCSDLSSVMSTMKYLKNKNKLYEKWLKEHDDGKPCINVIELAIAKVDENRIELLCIAMDELDLRDTIDLSSTEEIKLICAKAKIKTLDIVMDKIYSDGKKFDLKRDPKTGKDEIDLLLDTDRDKVDKLAFEINQNSCYKQKTLN